MALVYIERVKDNQAAFEKKVIAIANKHNMDANWLMVVMNFETAGTFSPSVRNPLSDAIGLIQFMPVTAVDLGTTTAELAAMSNIEQLDYVDRYYGKVILRQGTIDNVAEAYLAVFYPVAISWDMQTVFPQRVYRQNTVFDLNKDGQITKQEIINRILSTVPASYKTAIGQKKTS